MVETGHKNEMTSLEHRHMNMIRFVQVLLILASSLVAVSASSGLADDATPQSFLKRIYQPYQRSDKALDIGSEAKAARYFTPDLARRIGADVAEAAKRNEVGRLDFDPFIGGQDWAPRKIELKVNPGPAPDHASGTASFMPLGEKKRTVVTLDLVKTPSGWRISDIHWQGQSDSLLKILTAKE
jgi:hypothetical protein